MNCLSIMTFPFKASKMSTYRVITVCHLSQKRSFV